MGALGAGAHPRGSPALPAAGKIPAFPSAHPAPRTPVSKGEIAVQIGRSLLNPRWVHPERKSDCRWECHQQTLSSSVLSLVLGVGSRGQWGHEALSPPGAGGLSCFQGGKGGTGCFLGD